VDDPLEEAPFGDLDGQLLVEARREPEAFAAFYDRNLAIMLGFFYRRTACPHTSAELTAETFAGALAGLARFDPTRGTGRSWLFGIARNLYKQWLRRGRLQRRSRRRLGMADIAIVEDDLGRIEALVDLQRRRPLLSKALDDLPPKLRDAVLLRVGDDLPYPEVARRLGCTENNARVRVARGLNRLNILLEAIP
jgi:RNA polymerase sigma-70 factor (ECF subfamily)